MDQYYLYFIHQDGDGMLLTEYTDSNPNINEPPVLVRWTPHHKLRAWNMPLLFPTLEQAEVAKVEIVDDSILFGFTEDVKIGRWLGMSPAQRNQHYIVST